MKSGSSNSVPWDIGVFLIVTVVGFGYTIQNFSSRHLKHARLAQVALVGAGSEMLDLGCLENGNLPDRIVREGGLIRLKGQLCNRGQAELIERIQVRNLSNGHEATVYFQGDSGTFVTDYLNLKSGPNSVEVRWRESFESTPRALIAEVFER